MFSVKALRWKSVASQISSKLCCDFTPETSVAAAVVVPGTIKQACKSESGFVLRIQPRGVNHWWWWFAPR